eukprot:scaffold100_cov323-Pavlova_lutheri.AAC.33
MKGALKRSCSVPRYHHVPSHPFTSFVVPSDKMWIKCPSNLHVTRAASSLLARCAPVVEPRGSQENISNTLAIVWMRRFLRVGKVQTSEYRRS